jgi:hypothetical protein
MAGLNYGPMSYKALVLCDVKSIKPSTALSLKEFAGAGGKIIIIGEVPSRSLSFKNAAEDDSVVNAVFSELIEKRHVIILAPPKDRYNLREYSENLLKTALIEPDVFISKPSPDLFQIRKTYGDKDIFFFVNPNRKQSVSTLLKFPTGNKTPWKWNPEDGSRLVYPHGKNKTN